MKSANAVLAPFGVGRSRKAGKATSCMDRRIPSWLRATSPRACWHHNTSAGSQPCADALSDHARVLAHTLSLASQLAHDVELVE